MFYMYMSADNSYETPNTIAILVILFYRAEGYPQQFYAEAWTE